jgi:glutathione-independent formaldehyde dehydrogenase
MPQPQGIDRRSAIGNRLVRHGPAVHVGTLTPQRPAPAGRKQHHKERDRLNLAEKIGATAVDFSRGDPASQILDLTDGRGADCGVEAVGYQAHDPAGDEHPELVLDNLVKSVRSTGGIGVVGVYVPEDPGAANSQAKDGRIAFDYGTYFTKGQRMGTGQCPVMRYNRHLRDLISNERAHPSFLVSQEISLTDAATGYENFDNRENGWTKVLLHPAN